MDMVEVTNLLYMVVEDDDDDGDRDGEKAKESFRYTRPVLQSTLQLMGCKARHAFKLSKRVFEVIKSERFHDDLVKAEVMKPGSDASQGLLEKECDGAIEDCIGTDKEDRSSSKTVPYELYKRRTTVVVRRDTFLDVVCDSLTEYKYVGPNRRADLILACRIREKKESVTVLLCGTSGCGKSTLSALLASRLGITTVISTDSIRHMMRGFVDEKENPLVWASTYHAGEFLDPVAVAEAKAKRKAKKLAPHLLPKDNVANGSVAGKSDHRPSDEVPNKSDLISPKLMAVEGFKAQSEMVIESLDRLITAWEERKESVVVEGVHLSLNFVIGLMKKHPSIIPFMVSITNEDKHLERFAVRAKYMTLDPAKNKYAKYIRNIRTIQEYLCHRADKHLVPKINNTNVDKSVAAIHATVFGCLRRRVAGEKLLDPVTNTVALVDEEYRNQCTANSLSSKGMFQLIQRQGSSRHMMALINDDGSVAKAWPVSSLDSKGKPHLLLESENGIGSPLYGPLQIGRTESVNIQFGHFGLSVWPNDSCGTSHAGSVDESKHDGNEAGSSRYYSSCCSSPRMSDGAAKEPKEDDSVYGSDEEVDDPPEVNSDDSNDLVHEEMEGSVDEESTKSDEEYDDLAMQDVQQNGYWSDDDEETKYDKLELVSDVHVMNNTRENMYKENLDRFLSTKGEPLSELPDNQERRKPHHSNVRMKRRSMSIPSGKN